MNNPIPIKHSGTFDMEGLNRHVRVRYRCIPPNHGRVFIANSFKSVDASVFEPSKDRIGLTMGRYIEAGTIVRIEARDSGKVSYVDLVAKITRTSQLESGKWRCGCEWVRKLTTEELQVLRRRAFHTPGMGPLRRHLRPTSRECHFSFFG
jgi:hypothetical protein